MTAQLDTILHDIRCATASDAARSARHRRRAARALVVGSATLAASTGVAVATGSLPLGDLLNRGDGTVQVTPAGDGRHDVVLDLFGQLAGGGQARGVITDLGVTRQAASAPEADVCSTTGDGTLGCGGQAAGTATSTTPPTTIPAGTRVYRVVPEGAIGTVQHVVYIPARRLKLVIVGVPPIPTGPAR